MGASVSLSDDTVGSLNDGIATFDLAGNLVRCNARYKEIFQLSHSEAVEHDTMPLAYATTQVKDPLRFLFLVRKHFAEPHIETLDVIEMKDGRVFERHGLPHLIEGKCVGVDIYVREVSRRYRNNTALRLTEEKYRLLWETAGDAFLLFDRENRILEVNAAVTSIFGHPVEKVVGQNISLLQPEHLREGHRRGIQQYLLSGKKTLDWKVVETIGLHRCGKEIPVEIAINHLRLDGDDFFVGFIRDISSRKEAEKTQAHLAAIIDSSHDAIISKTLEGIVTSWNRGAKRIFGYSASEMIGQSILRLIPEDRAHEEPMLLERQARGERIDDFETVRVTKAGQRIDISITLSPIRDSSGTISGISKIARDITERKRAEAEREALLAREQRARDDAEKARKEAECADAAKDEFVSRMSHELRTPLNAIIGFGQLLKMQAAQLTPRQVEQIDQILRAGQHQLDLVNEVLDIARINSIDSTLSPEPVPLCEIVQEGLDMLRSLAESASISISPQLAATPVFVLADRQRLLQILLNLLDNAIKYNRPGGQVTLSADVLPDDRVRFQVSDNGPGIAPENLSKLFLPFSRLDAERQGIEGTGLGLVLSQRLALAMNGSLTVESQLGQGSTFLVELPLAPYVPSEGGDNASSSLQNEVSTASDPPTETASKKTVLLIEDNISNFHLIENVLEDFKDIQLLGAMQGGMGIELAKQNQPDLILLDLHLPDIMGDEVLRRLQEIPAIQHVPVVVLSVDATPVQVSRLLDQGAREYLTKPLDIEKFLQVVQEMMGRD
jgi:PAS domain S-box-containing protein